MTIEERLCYIAKNQEETLSLLKELQSNGVVNNNQKEVYDMTDLEGLLHVSRRTLFKWKSAGILNFIQIGKKLYITRDELNRFLTSNQIDEL